MVCHCWTPASVGVCGRCSLGCSADSSPESGGCVGAREVLFVGANVKGKGCSMQVLLDVWVIER